MENNIEPVMVLGHIVWEDHMNIWYNYSGIIIHNHVIKQVQPAVHHFLINVVLSFGSNDVNVINRRSCAGCPSIWSRGC